GQLLVVGKKRGRRFSGRGPITRKWSGRRDLNSRPHAPQACALPGCATSRPQRPRKKAANLPIQRYHLPSRSVKKLRRESRRSSSILRFNLTASPSVTVEAV